MLDGVAEVLVAWRHIAPGVAWCDKALGRERHKLGEVSQQRPTTTACTTGPLTSTSGPPPPAPAGWGRRRF